MNPKRTDKPEPKCKDHTEPFSELRTIPTGWDLSELSTLAHPVKEPKPSESLVDPQSETPTVEL